MEILSKLKSVNVIINSKLRRNDQCKQKIEPKTTSWYLSMILFSFLHVVIIREIFSSLLQLSSVDIPWASTIKITNRHSQTNFTLVLEIIIATAKLTLAANGMCRLNLGCLYVYIALLVPESVYRALIHLYVGLAVDITTLFLLIILIFQIKKANASNPSFDNATELHSDEKVYTVFETSL